MFFFLISFIGFTHLLDALIGLVLVVWWYLQESERAEEEEACMAGGSFFKTPMLLLYLVLAKFSPDPFFFLSLSILHVTIVLDIANKVANICS